jgi:hypothetical protein
MAASLHSRVPEAEAGQRLLDWLVRRFAYLDRARWRTALAAGAVQRNGRPATPDELVAAGDVIAFTPRADASAEPDVPVLHADDELVVVDKPAGLVVQHASAAPTRTFAPEAIEAGIDAILSLAVALHESTRRCSELESLAQGMHTGSAIVGATPVVRRLQSTISRAADCDMTVLVNGPAGAGKSLTARMIHAKSRRRRFVFAHRHKLRADPAFLQSQRDQHGKREQHRSQNQKA